MTSESQHEKAQSVPVIEADVFDGMNETKALIAQRAYEIYLSRGGTHGSDQDDWFSAEGELLPKLAIDYNVTDSAVQLTTQVPGLNAKDLEVAVGHRLAVVLGIHSDSNQGANGSPQNKKVMRVVELPFDVDPGLSKATLKGSTLQVVLPRAA
jgi:HSP20 family molecular chaperone IbpA